MHKNRGFTLIELLVVIAIIGILASIILASLSNAKTQARDAKRLSDIKEIQLALELYYDANTTYPTKISAANLVTPGYISVIPSDPSASGACVNDNSSDIGNCYAYTPLCVSGALTQPVGYHLGATLEIHGNSAMNSAADVQGNPPPEPGTGLVACTSAANADFNGGTAASCKGDAWGSVCYDVHS